MRRGIRQAKPKRIQMWNLDFVCLARIGEQHSTFMEKAKRVRAGLGGYNSVHTTNASRNLFSTYSSFLFMNEAMYICLYNLQFSIHVTTLFFFSQ